MKRTLRSVAWRRLVLGLLPVALVGQIAASEQPVLAPQDDPPVGPHHRVIHWTTTEPDDQGQPVTITNRYLELATGLHWQENPATGQWTATVEAFEVSPQGYALAVRGQHKAILNLMNLNSGGGRTAVVGHAERDSYIS